MDDFLKVIDRLRMRMLLRRYRLKRLQKNINNSEKVLTSPTESGIILDENDAHLPPGSPQGGQFAEKTAEEKYKDRVKAGEYVETLDRKKQRKHIAGTEENRKSKEAGEHKSVMSLTEDEIQKKFTTWKKNAVYHNKKDGSVRLIVRDKDVIGESTDIDGENAAPTHWVSIHCSNTGFHVYPISEEVAKIFVHEAKEDKKRILSSRHPDDDKKKK